MAPTSRAFIIFSAETISCKCPRWDQQIRYNNAHLWAWKWEQMPHLLGDKAKLLPVKEAVKPQIHEVNIINPPVLTVTNTNQATTSECLMKFNCILFIEYRPVAWAFSFRNNVTTMLKRCAILQTVKRDVFFQIGSFFLYKSSLQSSKQWHFLFKFFAKLSKLSPTRRSFFSTIDCSPSRMSTIAVLTPLIGQFGKSNNSKSYEWPHLL